MRCRTRRQSPSSSCSIQRRHLNPRRRHSRQSACSDYKIWSTAQPFIHLPHHYTEPFNDNKNNARPTGLKYLESGCNKNSLLFGSTKLRDARSMLGAAAGYEQIYRYEVTHINAWNEDPVRKTLK